MHATDLDFEQKVIARSRERAVVVDFWAPWCGPCLTLGPILERLAAEPDASFELVKVNVDESPQISAAMGVRGIPYVVAFRDGEPVKAFTGALPEPDVRRFLREVSGGLENEIAGRVAPLKDAIEHGDLDRAAELIEQLRMDPEVAPTLESLEARYRLARYAADHAPTLHGQAEQADLELAEGVQAALAGDPRGAFERLLAVVDAKREEARALLVDIIHLVDVDEAREMRRRLASALY